MSAEVGTARALSATASLSLDGVPNAPLAAPPISSDRQGRSFYIDSRHGDDAADGRRAHEAVLASEPGQGPWRSLARLMSSGLMAGDTVVLACGSVWRETLNLPANGTAALPIIVRAPVGCTTPPAIDGRVSLPPSAWTQHRGSIYKATLDGPALQVFSDSGLFNEAHHPNAGATAAEPTSPYLAMAADGNALATGNGSNIGSTVLNAGVEFANVAANATTSARVRVRINQYIVDDLPVSRFDGTQIVLQRATEHQARAGWGYFLLGQMWMLDSPGEWHFDPASKQLYAWMPSSAASASAAPTSAVSVSVLNTGVNLQGREHIVIDGLAVRGVGLGVDLRSSKSVQLRNNRIEDTADVGVLIPGSTQAVIESNLIARTGGDAITGWGVAMGSKLPDAASSTVRNNLIRDSGVLLQGEQVVSLPRRSVAAVYVGSNSTVSGNTIVNAGYLGIFANANNTITQNFVFGACSVLDDCAGIYTAGLNNNSQIRGNTVVRSRGMLAGQPLSSRATAAQGIYTAAIDRKSVV